MSRTSTVEPGPIHDVAGRLRVALPLLRQLVLQWESGQAQQPLSQFAASLERDLAEGPLTVLLCAATPQARAAWLVRLCGATTSDPAQLTASLTADIELRFGPGGFAMTHESFRQEYQRPDDLLVACVTMLSVRTSAADARRQPVIIHLPETAELRGLRLLLPLLPADESLSWPPRILSPLLRGWLSQSQLVLLTTDMAAASNWELSEDSERDQRLVVFPVAGESLGDWLTLLSRSAAWRDTLRLAWVVERCQSALDMVADRLAQETRAQDSRRRTLTWRLSRMADARNDREVQDILDAQRLLNEDGFEALETSLTERLRERTLPNAAPLNRLSNLMEDLSEEDFSEEAAGKVVRLRVSSDFLQRTLRLVQQQVHDDLRADVAWLDGQSLALAQSLNDCLAPLGEGFSLTRTGAWDETTLWKTLREQVHVDSRYHGEMPRRNWFDRLSEGRRPVFGIMMVVSMVGAAFGMRSGLTALLAPVMLVLFVIGTCWTFLSFREERRLILERELLRVRESFGQEVRRLYEVVAREWINLATKSARDLRKQWTREIDQLLRSLRIDQTSNAETRRKELQDKLKVIEQRQKELNGLLHQVQRLQQTNVELSRVSRGVVTALATELLA